MSEIRERWASRPAFVMAAIGSAVGLGNLWRFPYIAATHGGGAFLIPYFVAVLTTGIPLMILEYGLGQAMQGSAPSAFRRLRRRLEWIGWFALAISSVICIYYAAVMAWCWRYLGAAVTCEWGATTDEVGAFFDRTIARAGTPAAVSNINLWLVLGLALTWAAIYWIIYKGVHRVGRIVMITVPLPVVLILVLLVNGLRLDGATQGINYYLNPTWAKLIEPATWLAAYGQVFFSLTLGFGVLTAYASYLPRRKDVSNNAFITSFGNALVSFMAGFAVFSVLGYFALQTNAPINEVADAGIGLAFKVYPQAINSLPPVLGSYTHHIFGMIFFITLLSLGIDSAFSLVEAVVAGVHDKWPHVRRPAITGLFCVGAFLLGLVFLTDAGLVWLDIVDHWSLEYGLVFVGLIECIAIGWIAGIRPLGDAINEGAEIRVGLWWRVCIKLITPALLITMLVLNLIKEIGKPYSGYPVWALIVGGWFVIFAAATIGFILTRTTGTEVVE